MKPKVIDAAIPGILRRHPGKELTVEEIGKDIRGQRRGPRNRQVRKSLARLVARGQASKKAVWSGEKYYV